MQIDLVEKIVRSAAGTLRSSFESYWPAHGNTGAHERNLSLHIAHAFLGAGFSVYGEGHSRGTTKTRYDLLAYSRENRIFVAGEFKQLWSGKTKVALRQDLKRLRSFRPVTRKGFDLGSLTVVRLLAGFEETGDRHHEVGRLKFNSEVICKKHGRHPGRTDKELLLVFAAEAQSGA